MSIQDLVGRLFCDEGALDIYLHTNVCLQHRLLVLVCKETFLQLPSVTIVSWPEWWFCVLSLLVLFRSDHIIHAH